MPKTIRPISFVEGSTGTDKIAKTNAVVEKYLDDNNISYIIKKYDEKFKNITIRGMKHTSGTCYFISDDIVIVIDSIASLGDVDESRYRRSSIPKSNLDKLAMTIGYLHTPKDHTGNAMNEQDSWKETIRNDRRLAFKFINGLHKSSKSCIWTYSTVEGKHLKMSLAPLNKLMPLIEASNTYHDTAKKAHVTTKVNGIRLGGYSKRLMDSLLPAEVIDLKGNVSAPIIKVNTHTSDDKADVRYISTAETAKSDSWQSKTILSAKVTAKLNTTNMRYSFIKVEVEAGSGNSPVQNTAKIENVFGILEKLESKIEEMEWDAKPNLKVDMSSITNAITFPNFNVITKRLGGFSYSVTVRPAFENSADEKITDDDYLTLSDAGNLFELMNIVTDSIIID